MKFNQLLLSLISVAVVACANHSVPQGVPIQRAGGTSGLRHMLKVGATVSGKPTTCIFDTGIGVNLISKALCAELGCTVNGSVTGQRMTGQTITVPMSTVEHLEVAGLRSADVPVGVWDFDGFLPDRPEFEGIECYLSLGLFESHAFTVDARSGRFVIEDTESLRERERQGVAVPFTTKRTGPAVSIYIPVEAPNGEVLKMQLDLGTDILTINDTYVDRLSSHLTGTRRSERMKDETGHWRQRVYGKLKGTIRPAIERAPVQDNPRVMFSAIIYDGVIGGDYFKDQVTTYDLKNSRILLQVDR